MHKREVEEVVQSLLRSEKHPDNLNLVVESNSTEEWEDGWIVYYTTQEFLDTQDASYLLVGNFPIYVSPNGDTYETKLANQPHQYLPDFNRIIE